MANPAINPLSGHFRQPAIYLKLPSRGHFYPDNGIDLPVTGDIPVYPMTVRDELTLKTPDALMNGVGVINVIKSCCPNIRDPWNMPAVDLDPIFIAIRLASYGKGMDISCTCLHCKTSDDYTIDLTVILDGLEQADYSTPVKIDGLTFNFRPQTYRDLNQAGLITYEEQRLVDSIVRNEELSQDEKTAQFNASFEKLRQMNVDSVTVSIDSIETEDKIVVKDRAQIAEFLNQCSRQVYSNIKEHIQSLVDTFKVKPLKITCKDCKKEFENTLTFNQSNFFE
jgi:hypothetical protein